MSSKKIILAGCSYTINTWSDGEPLIPPYTFGGFLQHKYNLNVDHIAVSGNSNEASIKQIYNYIKDNVKVSSSSIWGCKFIHLFKKLNSPPILCKWVT